MKKFTLTAGVLMVLPLATQAQTLETVVGTIGDIIDLILPIAVALALLYFIWGLAQYILKAGDEDGREGARQTMIWGVIALFAIVSVWGLVNLLQDTFNIQPDQDVPAPRVQGL